jgi:hypothetical protein
MGQKSCSRKRPCRICGKWFAPHPRLGVRQMTCGASECQRQWHTRKCAEWNRKNRITFQENYLRNKLEALRGDPQEPPSLPPSPVPIAPIPPIPPLDYPRRVVQEVIGVQQLVIIEYIIRLLKRGVQEVIRTQPADIQREYRLQPPDVISRGDSLQGPCQGILSVRIVPPP